MTKKLLLSAAMSVFILSPHAVETMRQGDVYSGSGMMTSTQDTQRFSTIIDQAEQRKESVLSQPKEEVKVSGYSIDDMIEMVDFSDLAYKKVGAFKSVEDDTRVVLGDEKAAQGWKAYRFASATENSGFVFVEPAAMGGRTIVSFKGSDSKENFITDATVNLAYDKERDMRIHNGFLTAHRELKNPVNKILNQVAGNGKVFFTGHSLGAALASLAAIDYAKEFGASQFGGLATYASPRLLDLHAAEEAERLLGDKILRVEIAGDIVPASVFATIFNTKHIGQHVQLKSDPSLSMLEKHSLSNIRNNLLATKAAATKITDFLNTTGGFATNTPVVKQIHQARMWFGKNIGRNVHKQFSLGKDRLLELSCEAAEEAAKLPQTAIHAARNIIAAPWKALKSWWS